MELASVIHEPKGPLCYAVDARTLHIRLKTRKGDVSGVTLLAADPFNWRPSPETGIYEYATETMQRVEMKKEYVTRLHDCWFAEVTDIPWGRVKYGFVLHDGETSCFAGCHDFTPMGENGEPPADHSNYYMYPYILEEDLYKAPAWVKDTVWYQIFPDRFSRGGREDEAGLPEWGSEDADSYDRIYGGNLEGIVTRLDYIKELGASGIYFTPLFVSPSAHKYDTKDYFQIDPLFGTNEIFGTLVKEAHKRGIRVMLDAVFNHCGYEHPFWQDVLKNGRDSKYYDYFYIVDPERPIAPESQEGKFYGEHLNYRTFGFTEFMPKWNTANPEAREYLLSVAEFWVKEYGIDGWRLDVANEVSHEFWREFRKRVKVLNPDIYILGENWLNSNPWLLGDQFDAVMNYEFTTPAVRFFGTNLRNQEPYAPTEFMHAINELLIAYPKPVASSLFNLLDSHDTARILTLCGDNPDIAALAYVFQLTYAGSPSIYYGGEIGLGGDERHNRRCMPWKPEQQNRKLYETVRRLIALRQEHPSFREVDIEWLQADDDKRTLIYRKNAPSETLYVLIHHSAEPQSADVPEDWKGRSLTDLMTGETVDGDAPLKLGPYGFRLLLDRK